MYEERGAYSDVAKFIVVGTSKLDGVWYESRGRRTSFICSPVA